MSLRDSVELIIDRIRPALNADGGDIEVLGVDGSAVHIRLVGACAGCPSAEVTLQAVVETAVRRVRADLRVVQVRP